MSVGVGGGKSKNESGPTRTTRERVKTVWNAAEGAAGSIPQPILQAQGYFGGAQTAGQNGLNALSGDVNAAQSFMNPYQQQVIDAMNAQFGVDNQRTMNMVNDAATSARAFGGSRHGIATGTALAENARNQNMQVAGLLNSGFEGAMGRAGQVAGLGFDAARAGADLGMTAGSPDLWRLNVLKQGMEGMPYQTYGKGTNMGVNLGFGKK